MDTNMRQLATKLVMSIMTSSIPLDKQDALIEKIQQGTLTDQEYDEIMKVLEDDIQSIEYAKKIIEEEKAKK